VGVEPTIRSAKGRINGFEGRDSHRTIFASSGSIDHHKLLPRLHPTGGLRFSSDKEGRNYSIAVWQLGFY
jgi:hypothetical protein